MLSELRGNADVRPYYAELDRRSSADEVARPEELGHALLAEPDHPGLGSVFERVERLLALTPSAERAAAMVRPAGGLPPRRWSRWDWTAPPGTGVVVGESAGRQGCGGLRVGGCPTPPTTGSHGSPGTSACCAAARRTRPRGARRHRRGLTIRHQYPHGR